ncbi:O-antigen ligase family protein [Roseomonas sp. SSH11]|uniref:O-antigen ligase family protein n=1 Tax=Pararoseomonas baculiformis TaxID=2820812 RepID=A0ABS4AHX4_9PROT|nr:O-antigen ligase family protein [Pararoseomonas baculiformis]MBP0446596.1 O-antigen ligase family protein [Pararoseomonas baculiformis]
MSTAPFLVLPRPGAAGLAALAGLPAAAMQFAGALKSTPPLAGLPFDLTLVSAALLLPGLVLLAAGTRWRARPVLAPPLACAGLLWLWLVVAALWSPSREVLAAKLPEAVLAAPAMLLAGMVVGGDPGARRGLAAATLALGPFVAGTVAWGLAHGQVVLGGMVGANPEMVRVQYQLAGLAIACAAGLAALKVVETRGLLRLAWAGLTLVLALAGLLPGGRAGLIALGLAVMLAPAAHLWSARRGRAALGWVALTGGAGLLAIAALLADPGRAEGLRTLERFTGDGLAASARPLLWAEALRWAGETLPWGLGTGAFTLAAGNGERRGLYPHNHALEALAEGGLPGILLWLGAFGGGGLLLLGRLRALPPGAGGRLVALVLPIALGAMVSTDMGNRMVWFALGLALSAGLEAEPRRAGEPGIG